MSRRDHWLYWVCLTPTVVLLSVLMYYPMIGTVVESFYQTSFISPEPKFAGWAMYEKIVAGRDLPEIVRNTIFWTLGVVILQNLIGFGVALLLNIGLRGQGILRALILLPWIIPGVVAAILWRFMYDPQLGLINSLLIRMGLIENNVAWLASSSTAMAAVIIAAVWKGFPFSTLIYLAALQNVDKEQLEAATIDGAGPIRRLFDVTIPAVKEVILVNVVLTMILTFNYFDMVWVLTRGGPQNSTHIFPTKIFETGFGQFRFGDAAIYGVFSILVLAVMVCLYVLVQRMNDKRRGTA